MEVTLKEITKDNWRQCIDLKVGPGQQDFVASNLYSIAESKFEPDWAPQAIYQGEMMVGFTMYGPDPSTGSYWIIRLMVDERHQGQGYGRAAMQEIITRLKAIPNCTEIKISFAPENRIAERLYRSLGFQSTGLIIDGEVVLRLPVR
jgi:diamine N-acetyltransferase